MRCTAAVVAIMAILSLPACALPTSTGDAAPHLGVRPQGPGLMSHIALLKDVPAGQGRRGRREVLLLPTRTGHYRVAFGPFVANESLGADLSSNGRWFAYVGPAHQGGLYLVDLWHHRKRLLGHGLYAPYFSADGRYLALVSRPWPQPMPVRLAIYNVANRSRTSVPYTFGGYTWAQSRDVLMWPSVRMYQGARPGWVVEERPSNPVEVNKIRLVGCDYSCGGFVWQWRGSSVLYWRLTRRPREYNLLRLEPSGHAQHVQSRPVNCGKDCDIGGPAMETMRGDRIVTDYQMRPNDISVLFSVIQGRRLRVVRLAGHHQAPLGTWEVSRSGNALLINWGEYVGPNSDKYVTGVAMWQVGDKDAHEIGPYRHAFWVYPVPSSANALAAGASARSILRRSDHAMLAVPGLTFRGRTTNHFPGHFLLVGGVSGSADIRGGYRLRDYSGSVCVRGNCGPMAIPYSKFVVIGRRYAVRVHGTWRCRRNPVADPDGFVPSVLLGHEHGGLHLRGGMYAHQHVWLISSTTPSESRIALTLSSRTYRLLRFKARVRFTSPGHQLIKTTRTFHYPRFAPRIRLPKTCE